MEWNISYGANEEEKNKWKSYCDSLYPYFNICRDKTILEIGPYIGIQTQIIESHSPKALTLVEANKEVIPFLTENFKSTNVIHGDIFLYLEQPRVFDVVVCFGVLYHFHSPLYLLELIANRIAPKHICIETFATKALTLTVEDDNTPGARQLIDNWKSVNMSLKIPKDIIITAMSNLNYRLLQENASLEKPHSRVSPDFFVFEQL